MGLGRLELPTSRLSSARSNQLSYKPELYARPASFAGRLVLEEERETKTAVVPQDRPDWPFCSKRSRKRQITSDRRLLRIVLRKEVIQPQVPLRLPCYDFTPVADPTVVACLLAVGETPSGKTNSHGVTGGVYKARERIHRGVLIRAY